MLIVVVVVRIQVLNFEPMQSDSYKISVIISTYDDRAFVEKKLAEVRDQTIFDQCEFIFIESASPGKERELLEPFCVANQNCCLIKLEERVTLYKSWNIGWSEARAPLVCISNMDDTMHPRLLEFVALNMNSKKWDVATVLTAKQKLSEGTNTWHRDRIAKLDLSTRPGVFFAWRRELSSQIGMFDESLSIVGDKDFWSKVLSANLRVGLIRKVLYLYTKHDGQLSKRTEFLEARDLENRICEKKQYRYQWPSSIRRGVRIMRLFRKLPILNKFYLKYIYPDGG